MVNTAEGKRKGLLGKLPATKKGKLLLLLMGALLGTVLLIYGSWSGNENKTAGKNESPVEFNMYAEMTEKKIHELCEKVEGVSNVSVAVSFECGFKYVYAKENNDEKYLVIGSGSSESAVRVTEEPPVIGGVGTVCKGGGNPAVQNRLINLISAAFGISSNKIYITEAAK